MVIRGIPAHSEGILTDHASWKTARGARAADAAIGGTLEHTEKSSGSAMTSATSLLCSARL